MVLGLLSQAPTWAGTSTVPARTPGAAERQILVTFEQDSVPRLNRAGSTPRSYGRSGSYKTTPRSRRSTAALARDYDLRVVADWPIKALDLHCVVFEIAAESSREEILDRLAEDSRVESAQPMQLFESLAGTYDDPYFHLQHGVESMQVREAHRWAVGSGIEVAVVDTDIDRNHPDLPGRVSVAKDFVDDRGGDRPGRRPKDRPAELHGTAVAGIIAAAADNGIGIVGVAPEVELVALRACWEDEPGSTRATCNSFTLAKALAFAVNRRPDILNLSLGGPHDPLLERLVRRALDRGVVVVAARSRLPDEAPSFPSSIEGVLAVGTTEGREPVEGRAGADLSLLAPGTDILTTVPAGAYDFLSGSSFAAALVTGVVALLIERDPGLTPAGIHRLLAGSSRPVALTGELSGVVIDACAAVAEIVPGASCLSAEAGPGGSASD